jgi:hypothetical protein
MMNFRSNTEIRQNLKEIVLLCIVILKYLQSTSDPNPDELIALVMSTASSESTGMAAIMFFSSELRRAQ